GPIKNIRFHEVLLFFILLFAFFYSIKVRTTTLDIPFDRDEGGYAYGARLLLQGISPYDRVNNMRLPGMVWIYALFFKLAGTASETIRFFALILNLFTAVFIYLWGSRWIHPLTGISSCIVFLLFSLVPEIQGCMANSEQFVIFFGMAGIFFVNGFVEKNSRLSWLIPGGLSLGMAFIIKPYAASFILFSVFIFETGIFSIRKKISRVCLLHAVFFGCMALPLFIVFLVLLHHGCLESTWFWIHTYAAYYVSYIPFSVGMNLLKTQLVNIFCASKWLLFFIGLGMVSLFFLPRDEKKKSWIIVLFTFFSFLSVCPGFYFRGHYFILLTPSLSLLAGLGYFYLFRLLSNFNMPSQAVSVLTAVICGMIVLGSHHDPYPCSTERTFLGSFRAMGEKIRFVSQPGDKIAVLGSEPQILFYADRSSATSYLYIYPMMEPQPHALDMQNEMISQIEGESPEFLLFVFFQSSLGVTEDSEKKLFYWFEQYKKQYTMTGLVDYLSRDKIVFHWKKGLSHPLPAPRIGWIGIYRKKRPHENL
ncbi:MAG: glycosyltransferase family 39 protein, partial [Candidatus Aureabacteria bacterium]|nr:glycosyltransferase family 39 protein [Candidatus Auribacterota bacterium]